MSGKDIVVALEDRQVLGKGLAGIRGEGMVPAVIHNHGKPSIHVMGDYTTLAKAFSDAGKHHPLQLKVASGNHLALIKDVDFDPVKHRVRHVVFQAINRNEEVEAEVPVVFKEDVEIPAEKISLLVLKQLDHVEVKALPNNLPDQLFVDPSSLEKEGDHLTVADILVPQGVTILTDADNPIATVEVPKDQLAEADAAAASLAEDASAGAEEEAPAESGEATDSSDTTAEAK